MCGNGIRCVGKYVYEHHLTKKTEITIDCISVFSSTKAIVTPIYYTHNITEQNQC